MTTAKQYDHEELVDLIHGKPASLSRPSLIDANAAHKLAAELVEAGFRKIFDGDCGLSSITDEGDREAAEAWMRWANILNTQGDEERNGIEAMKQMLAEFGYKRQSARG